MVFCLHIFVSYFWHCILNHQFYLMKKIFTLFAALTMSAGAFAQIPNASFESWTTSGTANNPDSWGNLNSTTASLPLPTPVYTCEKGTTSAPDGSAFIKLTSKTVLTAVAPGVAVTGNLAVDLAAMTFNISGGFPYSTRSANLTGKWQHMGSGSDHGRVIVALSKWNTATSSRDTVALTDTTLTGMEMAWADFTIPLKYRSSSLTPDTGMIVLMASQDPTAAVNGSYLWVDKLAFSGTVPASVKPLAGTEAAVSVHPNPATAIANVYYESTSGKTIMVCLADIAGREQRKIEARVSAGENRVPVDLKGLAHGIYFVRVTDENGTIQRKLIIE